MTAAGGLGRLSLLNAMTQPSGPYRALVCVFLYGGNDSNNLVVDNSNYTAYKTIRAGLALDNTTLIPFDSNKRFGLHPKFTDLKPFTNQVALVANVGTLVQPTTRDQFMKGSVATPSNLFSHQDQQGEWQTGVAGGMATTGWAGRLADQMGHMNAGTYPLLVSVAGNAIFGIGDTTHPGSVIPNGPTGLQGIGTDAVSQARLAGLKAIVHQDALPTNAGALLLYQSAATMNRALTNADTLTTAVKGAPALKTVFPTTSIGQQLAEIAKLIQVRDKLQMSRQIFFCSLGGFDTHTSQLTAQDNLYGQLSPALAAFYAATEELTVANEVTTFTESDFSRTMLPNTNGGTDHAWGSHHVVMGGSVKGATMYGQFPTMQLNGPNDAGGEGRWIPSTSVDQYGATLAQWFGLPASSLASVFPNIGNFKANDVGFFG